MANVILKMFFLFLLCFVSGCATPSGMKWQKNGNSVATTNADIHDCRVNTALWWPFDTLSRCMHRRGYKLIGENEDSSPEVTNDIVRSDEQNEIYDKLVYLKKLKDKGIISEKEYQLKRDKYLSLY
nr:hypothetical protein [uncultured Desulfuromonas sp.]